MCELVSCSYSFCKAAREAFFLIARNIARIAVLGVVGDFVLLLGKLVITLGTGFFAYIVLSTMSDELNGLIGLVVVIVLLAYFVACMFLILIDFIQFNQCIIRS